MERTELRRCPKHGPVEARVLYEDMPGPAHKPMLVECPACTSERLADPSTPPTLPAPDAP